MKRKNFIFVFGLAILLPCLSGCEYPNGEPNNTGTGALAGGGIGAASGALIGGEHHAGEGALIGGAIGAVTGGLIGNSMDMEQQRRLREEAPQTYAHVDQGQPLSVADVKALAKAGIGEDVIINQISISHTIYHLSTADIIDLRDSGVSDRVINYMINTPNSTASNSSSEVAPSGNAVVESPPPPAPPAETVVVAPAPGYAWIEGEWIWNGRWVWLAGHWGYPPYPNAVWVRGYWSRDHDGWRRYPGHWR